MDIIKKLINYNFTPNSNTPKYIVVHDTGNKSWGANAEMHYKYFNGGDRNASAHFFVDDKQIIQTVEIYDSSFHCGDGRGKYGITNQNSIGIEICVNEDGDYGTALNNTIDLIVYLINTYKISFENIVRHYDASRKNCPATMNKNGDWYTWNKFKEDIKIKLNKKNVGGGNKVFNDFEQVSDWAKPSVERLKQLNIFKGDSENNFFPKQSISREEMAIVIDRLLKLLGK
jgi:N-acetylmuramoyl-L-alanine amidase CwlA